MIGHHGHVAQRYVGFIDLVIDVSVFEDADHSEHHFPPKPASG